MAHGGDALCRKSLSTDILDSYISNDIIYMNAIDGSRREITWTRLAAFIVRIPPRERWGSDESRLAHILDLDLWSKDVTFAVDASFTLSLRETLNFHEKKRGCRYLWSKHRKNAINDSSYRGILLYLYLYRNLRWQLLDY